MGSKKVFCVAHLRTMLLVWNFSKATSMWSSTTLLPQEPSPKYRRILLGAKTEASEWVDVTMREVTEAMTFHGPCLLILLIFCSYRYQTKTVCWRIDLLHCIEGEKGKKSKTCSSKSFKYIKICSLDINRPIQKAHSPLPKQRWAKTKVHLDVVACCVCQVPLRMARDILEAIREDVGIFEQVQQRFSDLHGSSDLGDVSALSLNNFLHSCSSCDRTRTLLHIFIVLQLTQFWLLLPQCLGILYLHNYIVGTELEYASNCWCNKEIKIKTIKQNWTILLYRVYARCLFMFVSKSRNPPYTIV